MKASRATPDPLEASTLAETAGVAPDSGLRARQRTKARHPWWLWPHLYSLDAPLVAVVWQRWLARCSRVPLPWQREAVLALAVWLIYLADRWVDGRNGQVAGHETARHVFSSQHRRRLGGLIAGLLTALVIVTPWWLTRRDFRAGIGLLVLSALYFWMTHGTKKNTWMSIFPKEAAVGTLFAMGTAAFVVLHCRSHDGELVVEVAGFAALCSLNCASITRWERTRGDLRNRSSLLNAFPKLVQGLPMICVGLTLLALAGSCFARSTAFLPLAGSAGLLGWLDHRRASISGNALRVLADLALLTPLLLGWP